MLFTTEKTRNGNIGMSTVSQELANKQALEMDLSLCHNCVNCWGCYGCTTCSNCVDCSMCGGCDNCTSCTRCRHCKEKRDLTDMTNSVDDRTEEKVLSIIEGYFHRPTPSSYNLPDDLKNDGIIPNRYILINVSQLGEFRKAGPAVLLKSVIESLIRKGHLVEMKPSELSKFGYRGAAYEVPFYRK